MVYNSNPCIYDFGNLPRISLLKTNQLTSAISKDVSLLIKHCHEGFIANETKMTILLIKNNTLNIDLGKWIPELFKNEKHSDYTQKFEHLITQHEIHYLNVTNLNEINKCIQEVQQSLLAGSRNTKRPFLVFIIGLDMLWDTEAYLLPTKKEKISILNNLFINIRSLKEFQQTAETKIIISLDEIHNIKANSFSMMGFLERFYISEQNVLLNLDIMRREINKSLYTNNIIKQSQDYH